MSDAWTLYDKIWDAHAASFVDSSDPMLCIDPHLLHETLTPRAFAGLREAGQA